MNKADGDVDILPFTLQRIGECEAAAINAAAVYAGHRSAQDLDTPTDSDLPMRHERVDVRRGPARNAIGQLS